MSAQYKRTAKRNEMLDEVVLKFKGTPLPEIRKKFGTLNIRRMTDILSDTFEQAPWYLARVARRKAQAERAKAVRKHVRFRKQSKTERKRSLETQQDETPEVS